jgi:methionine salvage enolase-phosphatase E1
VQPSLTSALVRQFVQQYDGGARMFVVLGVANAEIRRKRSYQVVCFCQGEISVDAQATFCKQLADYLRDQGYPDGEIVTCEQLTLLLAPEGNTGPQGNSLN